MQTGGRRKKRRGKRKWRKLIKKTEKKNTENKNGNKWRKINEWAEEEKWKYKEKERTKVKKQENYENRLKKKIKNLCERKFVKTKLKIKKGGVKVEEKWEEEAQKAEKMRIENFKRPPPKKNNRKKMQNIYVANAR